jgi:hypothetical protein
VRERERGRERAWEEGNEGERREGGRGREGERVLNDLDFGDWSL